MKNLLSVCVLSAVLFFALAACSDDDKQSPNLPPGASGVPESILSQFNEDYPDAQDVDWQQEGDYYVASFSTSQSRGNAAWYEDNGRWGMTKYEIPFSHLPAAVAEAYAASEYGQAGSGWHTDDEVDVLERRDGTETLYIIEPNARRQLAIVAGATLPGLPAGGLGRGRRRLGSGIYL